MAEHDPGVRLSPFYDGLFRVAALVHEALSLVCWLLFKPSAWRQLVDSIEPTLSEGFCLLYLRREQWTHPALRRLLLCGFIILPLFAASVEQMLRFVAHTEPVTLVSFLKDYVLNAAAKFSGMIRIGGILAVFISVGAGIIGMVVDIIFNEFIHQIFFAYTPHTYSTADGGFSQSYPGLCIAVLSVCSGFAVYVRLQRMSEKTQAGLRSIIGAAMLGLIFSAIIAMAQMAVLRRVNIKETLLFSGFCSISLAGIAGIVFHFRTQSWFIGVTRCMIFIVLYVFLMFVGSAFAEWVLKGASKALPGGAFAAISSCLILLLLAPLLIADLFGGAVSVAVTGAVGVCPCWLWLSTVQDTDQNSVKLVSVMVLVCGLSGMVLLAQQRFVVYPLQVAWNRLLYQLDIRRYGGQASYIRWHSAFWDELQTLRMDGLAEHLVLVCSRWPKEGLEALERIAAGPQRWAAQAAQLELEVQALARCTDLDSLSSVHKQLGVITAYGRGPDALRSFSRISQDISAARMRQQLYHRRIALRIVEEQIDRVARDLTLSSDRLAARFLLVLYRWRDILAEYQTQLRQQMAELLCIENPYVIGPPLSEDQEVFVGRTNVSAQIEKLIVNSHASALLLYGQRRMGKTSLLRNLGRLLPSTWLSLFVDLQGLANARSYSGFLSQFSRSLTGQLVRQRGISIEPLNEESLEGDPFMIFDLWLDHFVEKVPNSSALLMLDEFEQLDAALRSGWFDARPVLGMLRHVIQHKPRFRILLAGSHTLAEVSSWSSYLVNVRTVKLGCLRPDESRRLVERPIPEFALRYHEDAVNLVLSVTGGHPYLIQLVCDSIVELKNQQHPSLRFVATVEDVEAALEPALQGATLVFHEIAANQVTAAGRRLLGELARRGSAGGLLPGEHPEISAADEEMLWSQLELRDLVELTPRGYRFQIELIRRWFAQDTPL